MPKLTNINRSATITHLYFKTLTTRRCVARATVLIFLVVAARVGVDVILVVFVVRSVANAKALLKLGLLFVAVNSKARK